MNESYAAQIQQLVKDCLYEDHEVQSGEVPAGAVIVEGIVNQFGFDPEKVAKAKLHIAELLRKIPTDEFLKDKGGGFTFLNLCTDREGNLWGEHHNMEELCCLAIAAGYGGWCAPRDLWKAFPGGMPYVWFDPPGEQR